MTIDLAKSQPKTLTDRAPRGPVKITDHEFGVLQLTGEERREQCLSQATLQTALQFIQLNGYVLFSEIIPSELVAAVREEAAIERNRFAADHATNRGTNRYRLRLPFRPPFSDPRLSTNAILTQVLDALLGEGCVCNYLSCDIAMPGSKYQNIHSDSPTSPQSVSPPALVVNFNLVDFTDENGPLEIWPGATHRLPGFFPGMEAFARNLVIHRVLAREGSMLIRDVRVWHRGTANRSDHVRPNLAMVFAPDVIDSRFSPIGITPDQYRNLTPRQRVLFRREVARWSSATRLVSRGRELKGRVTRALKVSVDKSLPSAAAFARKLLHRNQEKLRYADAAADAESFEVGGDSRPEGEK